MKRLDVVKAAVCLGLALFAAACEKKAESQGTGTGPVSEPVVPAFDPNNFKVDKPSQFALTTTGEAESQPEMQVTGSVNADVSRQVPVPSLATGRITEIHARLGDQVTRGQLLFKVRSTDISGAYSNYLQAVKNEELTKLQLNRSKLLFDNGATPKSAVETAQNADDDNLVLVNAAKEQLKLLGVDPQNPTAIVEVHAPVSGTITDQQITDQSAVQAYGTPPPFTISDLSHVWLICDVYENNLSQVHLGEFADVRLNAYPDRLLKGKITNIGPILDPALRTAKVRLELANPGYMRLGMFATATFHGAKKMTYATLPSTAILHLHDREWVYIAKEDGHFQRVEVTTGRTLDGNIEEVVSGLKPGTRVVKNALDLQNTVN